MNTTYYNMRFSDSEQSIYFDLSSFLVLDMPYIQCLNWKKKLEWGCKRIIKICIPINIQILYYLSEAVPLHPP